MPGDYSFGMKADDITRRQAQAIKAKIDPMRDYLYRLRTRMMKRGFQPDDRLYQLVVEAQQAIGELYMDVSARAFGGPISPPADAETAWLDRRSARRRHDRR